MEEELEVIVAVFSQQNSSLKALERVLDSKTYRITERVRINAFKRLEQPTFETVASAYREVERDVKKIQNQITKTAQVLRYNIEIAEEGHSKAILVFTLVTIVFLPLSFVASLLGMNTTDTRNIEKNQTIFWAVALPTTAVIGGLSLLIAYGKIGDRLEAFREALRQSRSLRRHNDLASKQIHWRNRDEEETVQTDAKLPLLSSSVNRRRAEKKSLAMGSNLGMRLKEQPRKRRVVVKEAHGDDVVEVIEEPRRTGRRNTSAPVIKDMFF
ncbi:hypothetical protein EJ04DRAFT_574474 [Polyplosphaeria fusca]|uniref:Uncharacterized protein n=1 Tax=Polyplosphaeria fusca TaxID=682080 RepID=A0A9P4R3N2_9PLEO|nr:hypothetical protein EJ04DRAFT_574474 [Polyplosphaeria fusca]